jgi:hypothetical protein
LFLLTSFVRIDQARQGPGWHAHCHCAERNEPFANRRISMPRGDKSSYTGKQKRKAEHIEEGYEKRGISKKTAAKRAWATVNKQDGGGKKSGSGKATKKSSASKKSASKKSASKKSSGSKSARSRSTRSNGTGTARKKSTGRKTARKSTRSRRAS